MFETAASLGPFWFRPTRFYPFRSAPFSVFPFRFLPVSPFSVFSSKVFSKGGVLRDFLFWPPVYPLPAVFSIFSSAVRFHSFSVCPAFPCLPFLTENGGKNWKQNVCGRVVLKTGSRLIMADFETSVWKSIMRTKERRREETVASRTCNHPDHSVLYDTRCSPLFHAKRCFISPPFLCMQKPWTNGPICSLDLHNHVRN